MSTATFLILLAIVVGSGVLGFLIIAAWTARYLRDYAESHRGVTSEVQCPRTGLWTTVRIGRRQGEPGFHVLSCERFPDGAPRCHTECFRAFTGTGTRVA